MVTEDVRHVCDDKGCRNEAPFLPVYSACPAGQVSGDLLHRLWFCILCTAEYLDVQTCYAPYTSSTPPSVARIWAIDISGSSPAVEWYASGPRLSLIHI